VIRDKGEFLNSNSLYKIQTWIPAFAGMTGREEVMATKKGLSFQRKLESRSAPFFWNEECGIQNANLDPCLRRDDGKRGRGDKKRVVIPLKDGIQACPSGSWNPGYSFPSFFKTQNTEYRPGHLPPQV